jgi:hypothetical protein
VLDVRGFTRGARTLGKNFTISSGSEKDRGVPHAKSGLGARVLQKCPIR